MKRLRIVIEPLIAEQWRCRFEQNSSCGAFLQFEGVVRDHNEGKSVTHIDYQCFEPMALFQLEKILDEVNSRWPVQDVLLLHRVGRMNVGETSLLVMLATPHRKESFAAMDYIIDELKKRAPIWKKEGYTDGHSQWVMCHHTH